MTNQFRGSSRDWAQQTARRYHPMLLSIEELARLPMTLPDHALWAIYYQGDGQQTDYLLRHVPVLEGFSLTMGGTIWNQPGDPVIELRMGQDYQVEPLERKVVFTVPPEGYFRIEYFFIPGETQET